MPSLKKILRNIEQYTPEELAAFVRAGDCTVYQLNKSGYLSPITKRRIEALVAGTPDAAAADVISDAATAPRMTQPTPEHAQPSSPRTTIVDLAAMYQAAHGAEMPSQPAPAGAPPTDPRARRNVPAGMPPIPGQEDDGCPLHPGMVIEPKNLFD